MCVCVATGLADNGEFDEDACGRIETLEGVVGRYEQKEEGLADELTAAVGAVKEAFAKKGGS